MSIASLYWTVTASWGEWWLWAYVPFIVGVNAFSIYLRRRTVRLVMWRTGFWDTEGNPIEYEKWQAMQDAGTAQSKVRATIVRDLRSRSVSIIMTTWWGAMTDDVREYRDQPPVFATFKAASRADKEGTPVEATLMARYRRRSAAIRGHHAQVRQAAVVMTRPLVMHEFIPYPAKVPAHAR